MSSMQLPAGWFDVTNQLPSKGRFYSGRVYARPYSFAELASVAERLSVELKDEASAYRHVLSGMKMSDESDIENLFLGDFLFCVFYRKVISCGTTSFKLGDVFEGWESDPITLDMIDFKDIAAPSLPLVTLLGGEKKEFKPMTTKQYLNHLIEHGTHPTVTDVISYMTDGTVDANEIFDPVDVSALQEAIGLVHHGINPVTVKVRTKGGHEQLQEIILDSSQSTLVLPFRRPSTVEST